MPWIIYLVRVAIATCRCRAENNGDLVECRITGFETLVNPVRDLKK